MAVHVSGLIALLLFYLGILAVGLAAYWKKGRKKTGDEKGAETITVARRDIGWIIGTFTMTATWVGGGYINGVAEILFTSGLAGIQPPIGNSLALFIGGLFFAKPMREKKYLTMLDPFDQKYGKRVCAIMYLPAFAGEIMWVGVIMAALGSSVSVIMELNFSIAVIISMAFCISYVVVGGIYSVTWTDIAELSFVIFGLALCTPFIWCNDNVHLFHTKFTTNDTNTSLMTWSEFANDTSWIGSIKLDEIPLYIDTMLLCIFGAIPWQDYFQRVLSAKSAQRAQMLSIFSAFLSIIIAAIPSAMIGIAGRYTDWNGVGYNYEKATENSFMILPLSLEYLTPKAVAFFGIGAISAAVMSSGDASLLSIGGMFAHNVYKPLVRPKASEQEILWVLRVAIIIGGLCGALLAIFVESVVALWIFSCNLVYVILFPQLVCVLFVRCTNAIGAISGYMIGVILLFLGGEPGLHIPSVIKFPLYNYETQQQLFPVKTFAMLINLISTLLISVLVNYIHERKHKVDPNGDQNVNDLGIPAGQERRHSISPYLM